MNVDDDPFATLDKYDALLPTATGFVSDFGDQLVIEYDFFASAVLLALGGTLPFHDADGGDTGAELDQVFVAPDPGICDTDTDGEMIPLDMLAK